MSQEEGPADVSAVGPLAIPAERYGARLDVVRAALRDRGAAAVLLGPGAELRWLTGYGPLVLERLTLLVAPAEGPATLLVPRLEALGGAAAPAVVSGAVTLSTWAETDDPYARVRESLPVGASRLGARFLVSQPLWALHVLRLQAALPGARWELAATVMRGLRMVKDAEEVELLRAAAHAADEVVLAIAGGRLVGRTEADVAREVRERLVAAGHDQAAFWIVGSGPYAAEPHHEAGGRLIVAGEPIVLDIGGVRAGYCSDTTRTLWPTGGDPGRGPDDTFRRLYAALQEAQAAASAAVRPGVAAEAIDAVARKTIAAAGFGEAFTHRTGHGIGLEAHEDPYLVAGNRERLAVGHAFSVEPGIYLEGRYGARIEDIVVCRADGPDVLNGTPRELYVVNGA
jgi:Xaa-Pro aminopeptidase